MRISKSFIFTEDEVAAALHRFVKLRDDVDDLFGAVSESAEVFVVELPQEEEDDSRYFQLAFEWEE